MDVTFLSILEQPFYEASERDYRIVLATDAISVLYDRALQELKNIGVLVMNTDECIVWLGAPSYSKIQNI